MELGEEEMMIVGTVQQEDECSWQAACDAWEVQEEEATTVIYQGKVDQESVCIIVHCNCVRVYIGMIE